MTTWSTFTLPDQPAPTEENPLVLSFKYLPEDDALVVVLSNGDIEQIFLNGGVGEPVVSPLALLAIVQRLKPIARFVLLARKRRNFRRRDQSGRMESGR